MTKATDKSKSTEREREAFGNLVRQRRLTLGVSQEELADRCGLNRSHWGGIERGKYNLNLETMFKILRTLDVRPSEFFKGLDSLWDEVPVEKASGTPDGEREQPSGV